MVEEGRRGKEWQDSKKGKSFNYRFRFRNCNLCQSNTILSGWLAGWSCLAAVECRWLNSSLVVNTCIGETIMYLCSWEKDSPHKCVIESLRVKSRLEVGNGMPRQIDRQIQKNMRDVMKCEREKSRPIRRNLERQLANSLRKRRIEFACDVLA